jgi:hypothetical protein
MFLYKHLQFKQSMPICRCEGKVIECGVMEVNFGTGADNEYEGGCGGKGSMLVA